MAHALACEAEFHGYLVKAEGVRHSDTEVHSDNIALVLGEGGKCTFDFERERFLHQGLVGSGSVFVREHIHEVHIFVGDKRGVDRDVASGDAEDAFDFVFRYSQKFGQLLFRWGAFQFLLQFGDFFFQSVESSKLVGGESHNARILGNGLQDRLSDPPHGVGDELESASFVEAFGGFNKSHIAFVDEVGEAKSLVLVLFCNRDDEAQVSLRQAVECCLVAGFDALSQLNFLFGCQQLFAANVLKILVERFDVAVGDGMGNF